MDLTSDPAKSLMGKRKGMKGMKASAKPPTKGQYFRQTQEKVKIPFHLLLHI